MQITEFLNGQTIEDIRRNTDMSVTFFCDSGRVITLHVENQEIKAKQINWKRLDKLEYDLEVAYSERMRLREAFIGFRIDHVIYDASGNLIFVCNPEKHSTEKYTLSYGHREITVTHSNGSIDELPPVSAKIGLPGLDVFPKQGT